jgi:hypothetical protein
VKVRNCAVAVCVAVCAGVIPEVAVASADTGTLPSTIQYGTATVAVPSSGTVVLDGQPVTVMPGARRIFFVSPPAGSTVGASTGVSLPAGASAEYFTFPSPSSTATTVQSTITPPSAAAPSTADDETIGCKVESGDPAQVSGIRQVKATGNLENYSSGIPCTNAIQTNLTVTLYSSPTSGSYTWTNRGHSEATIKGTGSHPVQTACPSSNLTWHSRSDYTSLDTNNGDENIGYVNSDNVFIPC